MAGLTLSIARLSVTTGSVPVLSRHALESGVDDALRHSLLAVLEDLADELGDQLRAVDRVRDEGALGSGTLARHYFSFFAP